MFRVTIFPEILLKVLQFDLSTELLYLIRQGGNSKCLYDMCLFKWNISD